MNSKKQDNDNKNEYIDIVIERIKKYMEYNNITQTRMAEKCDIKQSTLSKLLKKQSSFTLIHLEKIAKAMGTDPSYLVSFSNSVYDNIHNYYERQRTSHESQDVFSDGLVFNPAKFSFRGMLGTYYFYCNPTISSERKLLEGILTLEASNTEDNHCITKLKLYTGHQDEKGEDIYKNYIGQTIISLPMSSCLSMMISYENADFAVLNWHHIFLNHEDLQCRIASCMTTSSGSNRRPVLLKCIISRTRLNSEDLNNWMGELKMNSGEIHIIKEDLESCSKNMTEEELSLFVKHVLSGTKEIYTLHEANISSLPIDDINRKYEIISMIRNAAISNSYIKVSNKTDERLYSYIMKKKREEYQKEKTNSTTV